jgi:hypothetical protein
VSKTLRLSCERFSEFARYWLLPLLLGFVIGLAIFLLVNIYRLLNFVSLLVVNWNSLLLPASTITALLGGYLTVKFLAKNKECGCGTDFMIERYHLGSSICCISFHGIF